MTPHRTSDSRPPNGRKQRWRVFLGGVLVGCVLVVTLLFTPAVQGWLLKRYIGAQPGWRLDFARFFAGPTGVELDDVDFAMPGIEARTEPVRVQIAPTQLLRNRQLRIEKVEAKKVRLIITPEKFATTAPTPGAPFAGLLPLLRLPVVWAVDQVDLDGQIILNQGGESVIVGDFAIQGGGLAPGQRGELAYEISFNSTLLPLAPGNHVRSRGTIQLTQTRDQGVARLELDGTLALPAYGQLKLPEGKFHLTIEPATTGEHYRAELNFGEAGQFTLAGQIDAAAGKLLAQLEWAMRDTLLANAIAEPLPTLLTRGSAEGSLDLESVDLTAALKGQFTGRDWKNYLPELALVPEFTGDWQASITRAGGRLNLQNFSLRARAQNAPAEIELRQDAPVDLLALPETPFATLALRGLPVAWANPWLAGSGVTVGGANFAGRWSVAVDQNLTAHIHALEPAGATDIAVAGLPVPPVSIALSSDAIIDAKAFFLPPAKLQISTSAGDILGGELGLLYNFATEATTIRTNLSGALPTFFGAEATSPTLQLDTQFTQQGDHLRLEQLQLELLAPNRPPSLTVSLRHELTIDPSTLRPVKPPATPTDLLTIIGQGFALDWASRGIEGVAISGAITTGRSTLSSTAEGKLQLATNEPWRTDTLRLNTGGAQVTTVVSAQPTVTVSPGENQVTADLVLTADLADLPLSEGTFGPLKLALHLNAQNHGRSLAIVNAFDLRVTQSADARDLLVLHAGEPFIAGLSDRGTAVLSTVAPLKLSLGELPLPWLQPWLGDTQIEGVLAPTEFLIASQVTRMNVRPARPVSISGLSVRSAGCDLLKQADIAFYPGLDLTLICTVEPKFQLGFEGLARVDNTVVKLAQRDALDLDLALRFLGDTGTVLPAGVELTTRAKLAAWHALPWLAAQGLPATGTLVARVNGDMLGQNPIELWTRLEGVPTADGASLIAPLEISARGKVDGDQRSVTGDVQVILDTLPQRSDAAFQAKLDLREANLHIASALTSRYLDLAAMMGVVDAFTARAANGNAPPPTPAIAAANPPTIATPGTSLGGPFWSVLRGVFDLDIGTLEFAPYRIDRVTGRLALDETSAVVSNLHGEMFAGDWSGGARIDFLRDDPQGDHHLAGEFNIAQFESARVVQTVFPDNDLASLDALINVRATVNSTGNRLPDLLNRAEAKFEIDGTQGTVRLRVPKQDLIATAAVFGGTILL
ncbi:MAG: hypothetical protein IT582_00980, partial [Opitutaceae bacterium]|nr:hypothetical protein [Opitutaceae bacterium]